MKYVGNILYDLDLLKDNQKFIIFGTGVYGKKVLQYLEINGAKENVVGFCDSNEKLSGTKIDNISVYHTNDACLQYSEATYLISGKYTDEMYKILNKKGISRIHILFI